MRLATTVGWSYSDAQENNRETKHVASSDNKRSALPVGL